MKKVLGIGNALVDVLAKVESELILKDLDLPKGSMQLIDAHRYATISERLARFPSKRTTGGSACNTILALAHLGTPAGIIGKIGNDEPGRFFADYFSELGVDTHLTNSHLPTGIASTLITPDGQRTFGTFLGAASTLAAGDLKEEWFKGYDYFYIEGYLVQNHALIDRAVKMAKKAGLQVCLDLASYNIVEQDREFFTHLVSMTDIVFANEEEARAFTGGQPAEEAIANLAHTCRIAVVKIGKRGVIVSSEGRIAKCGARNVSAVVDTTAAGDYFSAGFLHGLAKGHDVEHCAKLGSLLAGHVIEVVGTALDQQTWEKLRLAAQ